jgi:prefoldin subunit 5
MPINIETDLRDILNKLDQRFDKIDQRFERMEQSLIDLRVGHTEINREIRTVNTKIDGLNDKISGEIRTFNTQINGVNDKISGLNDKTGELQKSVDKLSIDVSDLKGAKSLIVPGFVAIFASLLTPIFKNIIF